jgi:hypothetical protein
MDPSRFAGREEMRPADWILRFIVAVNVVILIVTFIPGLADRWWGDGQAGFRDDFVWMCASSIVLFVGALEPTVERSRRTTAILCRRWFFGFFIYLCYSVTHMF